MADIQKKLVISLVMGLLFFVVNLPLVYKLVNELLPVDVSLYDYGTKCPTLYGQLLHTVVFSLAVLIQMYVKEYALDYKCKPFGLKVKYTIYSGLVFFLLSSPAMYKLVGQLTNGLVADSNGCPSYVGVLVHAVVYIVVLLFLMYLPKKYEKKKDKVDDEQDDEQDDEKKDDEEDEEENEETQEDTQDDEETME